MPGPARPVTARPRTCHRTPEPGAVDRTRPLGAARVGAGSSALNTVGNQELARLSITMWSTAARLPGVPDDANRPARHRAGRTDATTPGVVPAATPARTRRPCRRSRPQRRRSPRPRRRTRQPHRRTPCPEERAQRPDRLHGVLLVGGLDRHHADHVVVLEVQATPTPSPGRTAPRGRRSTAVRTPRPRCGSANRSASASTRGRANIMIAAPRQRPRPIMAIWSPRWKTPGPSPTEPCRPNDTDVNTTRTATADTRHTTRNRRGRKTTAVPTAPESATFPFAGPPGTPRPRATLPLRCAAALRAAVNPPAAPRHSRAPPLRPARQAAARRLDHRLRTKGAV